MSGLETNVFPILNLAELVTKYTLSRIRGLNAEQPEYFQNRQALIRKLSFTLRRPVTIIERDEEPWLVLPSDVAVPSSPFLLVRTAVYFDTPTDERSVDFSIRDAANDEIGRRFLQFLLQQPLTSNSHLWQPGAGRPFYERQTAEKIGQLLRYRGFSVRVVPTIDTGLALSVDVSHKVVGARPLPVHMSREQFRQWRGPRCIYRFGYQWFEIRPTAFSSLTVSEERFLEDAKEWTLFDYIAAKSRKPIPAELANLPHDASVLYYSSNQGQQRSAPTGLCHQVYDTHSNEVKRSHGATLLNARERRSLIQQFVIKYLQNVRFGNYTLKLADEPIRAPQKLFLMPDLEFGRDQVLSVRGTAHAQQVTLDRVGRRRLDLLRDPDAGFFIKESLDRQYLFLPQSIQDSCGSAFVRDLVAAAAELAQTKTVYQPVIVPYNDRGPRTFVHQGRAILEAADAQCQLPGYALVMIHPTTDQKARHHDQLSAMVIRELNKRDIRAAVNHSSMSRQSYDLVAGRDGSPYYRIRPGSESRFRGYLRAVALNKIFLNNERWPFVLATPTHADVTIGIDVKHHTAGFTIVGKRGSLIRTILVSSSQKEQLLEDQVAKYIGEIIRKEALEPGISIRTVVIHRDGRVWPSELRGIAKAFRSLKKDGIVPPDVAYTILEIAKSAVAPVRLFDVGRDWVENPQIGNYWIATDSDGFLCATGRPFARSGTVQPLHVRFVEGTMPFELCLEDVYYLTALAWTRPEDCTRYPITIKLNDRRLGDDASEYDQDALEFAEAEMAEEAR
jgi:hypothetical protein